MSPPESETSQEAGPLEPLGSRRRGPDERRAIPERKDELFSRQIALAYEREAIRLRRFRLDHPLPAETHVKVDERGRATGPTRVDPAEAARTILGRLRRMVRGVPNQTESTEPGSSLTAGAE